MSDIQRINLGTSSAYMSGFDADYELVADAAHGARSWQINEDGTLSAITYTSYVWKPGKNKATCEYKWKHKALGFEKCSCGFYSYHDKEPCLFYTCSSYINGVVRVTGKTVVGSKGFRSSEAEIIALAREKSFPRPSTSIDYLFFAFMLIAYASAITRSFANNGPLVGSITSLVLIGFLVAIVRMFFDTPSYAQSKISKETITKIQKHYPGVHIYKNTREMLKAHPISSFDM